MLVVLPPICLTVTMKIIMILDNLLSLCQSDLEVWNYRYEYLYAIWHFWENTAVIHGSHNDVTILALFASFLRRQIMANELKPTLSAKVD